jgi:uncharacterized protein DUF3108
MGTVGLEGRFSQLSFIMKYRIRLFAIVLIVSMLAAFAPLTAAPHELVSNPGESQILPFDPAEKLVYEGEFTRSLLRGINVAELQFSFTRIPAKKLEMSADVPAAFLFTAEAVSKGIVSKLFGINFRQRIESTVEPTTFSVLQNTKLDEQGKRLRTSRTVFDQSTGGLVFTERDPNDPQRAPRVVTNSVNGSVQDIASAIYFLRTQKLEPGKTLELVISDTGVIYHIPVNVSKGEKMKTVVGKVSTLRVQPEMFGEGRLIRTKGEITIWFTDDARRIPVRARIKNNLGRFDIKLKSITRGS